MMLTLLATLLVSGSSLSATLASGQFEVEYSGHNEALARQGLAILEHVRSELDDRLPAGEAPIRIVICSTQSDFLRYAGTYTQSSVTGIALPEQGLIAVKDPRVFPNTEDFKSTLRHECIHVLLARNVPEEFLPRWLNEGVTMSLAREHRWSSKMEVAEMYLRGRIIRYHDLSFALLAPGSEMEFGGAYAQSLSMTQFLMDRLGDETFWSLLHALRTQDFDAALRRYAGITPFQLWKAWYDSLWKVALISTLVSGFSVFQVMAVLVVLAYWRTHRRGQQILRRWKEEELGLRPAEETDQPYEDDAYPWEDEDEDDSYRW